ncbi:MAG: Mov34/MPN/PAD-1 family protein [Promethearchaeota archaeon]
MINEIEKQYQDIIENYPNALAIRNSISHIKIDLSNKIILEINYSKYPKRPKVILINQSGSIYKNLNNEITSLKNWKKNNVKSVLSVIKEINLTIKRLQSNIVRIKRELLDGFFALCRAHHPKEFLGILKMEKNVFTEFILPPGAVTSRNTGVFFPGRIPINRDYQGTIHSHPSGNVIPSLQDLNSVFKGNRFHFIVGFPYTLNHIKCYDKNGTELQFRVIN